ncbi:MAG: pyridoxal-phosphate dependent enzyme, partial [Clostridia bacterium]|nr:pyridoxal-phosphate dependent enzyme [Clostridia bacterium]
MMLNLDNVYRAKHALREVIYNTDLIYAKSLSEVNDIYLKAENLQITGSFKVRGAYYKISTLTEKEREKGIIACSAGNHAQGVALSGAKLNVKTKIFIPSLAPLSKVEATKKYGAEVVLIDGIYDDAYLAAKEEAARSGAIFIHPFDDEDVMAGQGTIGLELLDALPSLDAVVIPIGGGGLASGVAYTIKTLKPSCKVYGVQAAGASSMFQWVQTKTRSCESKVSTFADGIAVKNPGELT